MADSIEDHGDSLLQISRDLRPAYNVQPTIKRNSNCSFYTISKTTKTTFTT